MNFNFQDILNKIKEKLPIPDKLKGMINTSSSTPVSSEPAPAQQSGMAGGKRSRKHKTRKNKKSTKGKKTHYKKTSKHHRGKKSKRTFRKK